MIRIEIPAWWFIVAALWVVLPFTFYFVWWLVIVWYDHRNAQRLRKRHE